MDKLAFFSLQGLGNSILAFPIFLNLRTRFDCEVVAFRNGSSAFYRAFGARVREVHSARDLVRRARRMQADASFVCFPSWRREIAAQLLVGAKTKFFLRPADRAWLGLVYPNAPKAWPNAHNLEENYRLLENALGRDSLSLDVGRALSIDVARGAVPRKLAIHPTASTPHKYYPLAFWAKLLVEMRDDFDVLEIYCGTNTGEIGFCRSIVSQIRGAWADRVNVHAGLEFRELTEKLAAARAFVGSDSSLMHLAALLDVAVVGLWSFANYKVIYPYGNRASVYIPRETLAARTHAYPEHALPYLARASAADVAAIVRRAREAQFQIQPKYKNAVDFHVY